MLKDYQKEINKQFKKEGWEYYPPLSMFARLSEEVGEVARLMNSMFGKKKKKISEQEQDLAEELADVIFASICIANSQGLDLDKAMRKVIDKGPARQKERK